MGITSNIARKKLLKPGDERPNYRFSVRMSKLAGTLKKRFSFKPDNKAPPMAPIKEEGIALNKEEFKYDVFLTHDWGTDEKNRNNHARVSALNRKLQALRVRTWFDEERLEGDIDVEMASGVEQSKKVVVCITERYRDKVNKTGKDNCATEFRHATVQRGLDNIIPVVMESRMLDQKTWTGRLGAMLSTKLFQNYTEDRMLDEVAKKIKDQI